MHAHDPVIDASTCSLAEYVSTRWYRAPEVLLRTRDYNAPVDMFAVGCIMAELVMLRPLFPGNSESDMIQRVCQIMGTPNSSIWAEGDSRVREKIRRIGSRDGPNRRTENCAGLKIAAARRVKFPNYPKTPLQKLMPHASSVCIDIMDKMMDWDPAKRLTCRSVAAWE